MSPSIHMEKGHILEDADHLQARIIAAKERVTFSR
jgi:hypothetical protein